MQEFQILTESCRTIHSFKQTSIPLESVTNALELSLMAPNHRFTFPWKYYLVGKSTQLKIVERVLEIKFGSNWTPENKETITPKLLNPTMIMVGQKLNKDVFIAKEDYATMACSIQLMALSLANEGIGYKWSTGAFIRDDRVYDLCGISKNEEEIIGCILVGYALVAPKPRRRPPLCDILTEV